MKILHELNQLEMGGAERIVLGIIKHDKKNQHIVYTYKDGPMRKPLEEAGAKIVIESKEQVALDIDLIHIHTGGSESLIASCTKGELLTVETVHSPVVSAVRDEWVHARVGVSNQVTKLNRKCRTIYNGVDVDRLMSREYSPNQHEVALRPLRDRLEIPKQAFVVGRLGRIAPDKCVEEWLVSCKMFQDSCGIDWKDIRAPHFLIVGDEASNANGHLSKMKISAASLPLRNVHFVPATEYVGEAYEAMDLFVYPSPTEGFGLVYMEAMACGIPCVLWENDLTMEIAMGAALLVKPNVVDLAKGIQFLFSRNDLREEIGLNGKENALANFSSEKMSEEYQEFYSEILKKHLLESGATI